MGEEERRDEEVMKSLLALELVQFLLGCYSFHVLVSGLLRVIVVSMGLCCEHSLRVSEERLLLRGLRSPVAICLVGSMISGTQQTRRSSALHRHPCRFF